MSRQAFRDWMALCGRPVFSQQKNIKHLPDLLLDLYEHSLMLTLPQFLDNFSYAFVK